MKRTVYARRFETNRSCGRSGGEQRASCHAHRDFEVLDPWHDVHTQIDQSESVESESAHGFSRKGR